MQVTETAAEILKQVREQAGAPESAGVRLHPEAADDGAVGIAMNFTDEPIEGDQVIDEQGLRVFVAGDLAEALAERTLDVSESAEGIALTIR